MQAPPQGRERLKELLDAGETVPMRYRERLNPDFYRSIFAFRASDGYRIMGTDVSKEFDDLFFSFDEFLDPSPRLEPSELQWVSNALGEWAYHGDWTFRAGYDGTWYANYKDRYVDGIGTMHERETSVEYAKSAIHEWRVKHLKSML